MAANGRGHATLPLWRARGDIMIDTLQTIFLESRIWLGVVAFVGFDVVLLMRRRAESRAARRYAIPVFLLIILLLFVLQSFVVTEREAIRQATQELIAAFEREDLSAWNAIISVRFDADGMTRDDLARDVAYAFERIDVYDTRMARADVAVDGDTAQLILGVRTTVQIGDGPGDFHTARWRFDWRREDDVWRVTSIHPESLDAIEITSFQRLRGLIP